MNFARILSPVVLIMCFAVMASEATAAIMPVPTPIVFGGTPTCADINASGDVAFAHIVEDWGLRVNRSSSTPFDANFFFVNGPDTELQGGAGPRPERFVHIAASGNTLNWNSNLPITAVIVQGGPLGSFVYPYNPGSFGGFPNSDGTGLTTAAGCAAITHATFCFQAIGPTAAPVSVSGRVTTASGTGINGARLTLVNNQNGDTSTATTNPLGYFTFESVPSGSFYTLTVSHRRHTFANNPRTFTLSEDFNGADFVANP